jgi:hypothetical protein
MANCEKCGAAFTPSAATTEVTSLRILCPQCEADRRAEKAARAKAAAAAQAAPRPAPQQAGRTPSTPPAPSAAPAPRKAKTPSAGATRGASRRSAKRAVGTGIHGAEAKALHGAPAKRLYHKPVKKTDEEHGGTDFHPDVQRELQFLQQRESKVMKIAWIVCGVLLVAAGAFAFAAKTKRDRTIAAAEAYQKRIDDFAAEMQGKEIESEAGAKAAIAHAEAHANIGWESDLKAGAAVGSVISKAKSRLAKIDELLKSKEEEVMAI